jgi:glycerol kinase
MPSYILALDQGTTSSRSILFDKESRVAAKAQRAFAQIYPQPGWVEHDPFAILDSQFQTMADLAAQGLTGARDIAAIGITNQRETTVVWEKATGKPVCNAIVWQCRRTASLCEELMAQGLDPYIRKKTGLVADAYFSGTKIKWILDNIPGARKKADAGQLLFGTVDTWLIWNLTGGRVHATDYSNAGRTMLFDADALRWDPLLCETLGIPMAMLPEVLPSGGDFGTVESDDPLLAAFRGVPIRSAIGDQPAALFGQACFETGQAKNTYGTGCFLLMNTGEKRVHSKHNLISGAAWGFGGKVTYALEGSAFNAGSVIQWLRDELGLIQTAHECDTLAESVPDAGGAYLVPAFTGLGAPYWDMYARGCLVGLTRGVNKRHIARAALEGITFQLTDLLKAMAADAGISISELRVDGGASVSDIMMQIQADVAGILVNRPKNIETTALGAAYLAGLAAGFWAGPEEIERGRVTDKKFPPGISHAERESRYANWQRAVERARGWQVKI